MDIDALIAEFTGRAPAATRTPEELEGAYGRVIDALIGTPPPPGAKIPPQQVLDEIVVRAGAPGTDAPRAAMERALLGALARKASLNERIFLLRELAIAGGEDAVPALVALLADRDAAVRGYALRALDANPSAAAGRALIDALGRADDAFLRLTILNALGRRREPAAVGAVAGLIESSDREVAAAALAALGSIGTREARDALSRARLPNDLLLERAHARLLCAERLRANGDGEAAAQVVREIRESLSALPEGARAIIGGAAAFTGAPAPRT